VPQCYCKPTHNSADGCFAAKVVNLESPPAAAVKLEDIKASLEQHKPAALFLCQVIMIVYESNASNDEYVRCALSSLL